MTVWGAGSMFGNDTIQRATEEKRDEQVDVDTRPDIHSFDVVGVWPGSLRHVPEAGSGGV